MLSLVDSTGVESVTGITNPVYKSCPHGGGMDLKPLFYPRNIAIVGASPNLGSGKLPFYQFIQAAGFKGGIFPVNPAYSEINGARVYPSLADIPEPVDYAVISVPARAVLENLEIAIRLQIPFVHFFTSGFSETGNSALEAEMLDLTKGQQTRIVGPNCFGVFCWESGLTFSYRVRQSEPGTIAFLGQSGSLTDLFLSVAGSRSIPVNKAVSYGNQIDLRVEDYLTYLAEDDEIDTIAAYIEDIKDGSGFLKALQQAASKKRVIIMKGGVSPMGAQAAQSHTGAMMQPGELFPAALKQTGSIYVRTFEEMIDLAMVTTAARKPVGTRVGYIGGGGGISVIAADVCSDIGLSMPSMEPETVQQIRVKTADVNTSFSNPVDLGAFGYDHSMMLDIIELMCKDRNLDLVIPQFIIGIFPKEPELDAESTISRLKQLKKPVYPIITTFSEHNSDHLAAKSKMFYLFRKAGLPVFNSIQEVAASLNHILPA